MPLPEIEKYIQSKLGPQIPTHDPAPIEPGAIDKVLGVIASTGRDIPGVEAAQAGVRSLVRRQSYREALSDIRGAEDAAPIAATLPARLAGSALATAVLPGGAAAKGAQFGGLTGALSSDPNSGIESRAIGAGVGAATGALAGRYMGKLADRMAPAAGRARDAAVTRLSLRDAVRPAMRLGEGSPAKAEGFIGNSIDNLREVPITPAAAEDPITVQLRGLLDKVGAKPAQAPFIGDAEVAMGLHQAPAMSLEEQLAASVDHIAQGGSLSSAKGAAQRYGGRPIILRKP